MYSLIGRAGNRRVKPAFTIAELLVVVLALAVVSSIVLPRLLSSSTRAKEIELKADLGMLRGAIEAFRSDTGHFPRTLGDLSATDATQVRLADGAVVGRDDWRGPYVEDVPRDPVCGGEFRYEAAAGKVSSATSGPALDGSQYSTW